MKLLIVYSTKGGLSEQCANILAEKLSGAVESTLCKVGSPLPSPADFDAAVIGGSVRFGKINKHLKKYIKDNARVLSQMPAAFFLLCGFPDKFDEYIEFQLPKSVSFSLGCHCFGGELKPQKLKGLDKLLVMAIRSEIKSVDPDDPHAAGKYLPEMVPENISILADSIRALL